MMALLQKKMEAARRKDKRKPLSDLTNLVPKPLDSFSESNRKSLAGSSVLSDSSIGSSKFITDFQNPTPLSTNSATATDNGQKNDPSVIYSTTRQQSAKKIKGKCDAATMHLSSRYANRTRDKGKVDSAARNWSTVEKTRDKGKAMTVPDCGPPLENIKDKLRDVSVPVSGNYLVKVKDKGNEIDVCVDLPDFAKTKDKRKSIGIVISDNGGSDEPRVICTRRKSENETTNKGDTATTRLSCDFLDKTKGKEQVNSLVHSCSNAEKTQEKGKAVAVLLDSPYPEYTQNKGKEVCVSYGSISSVKRKDKGKAIDGAGDLSMFPKSKEKGKAVSIATDYSCSQMITVKTCPPLLRTRKNRNKLDKSGDVSPSKSKTDLNPTNKKRRCSTSNASVQKYALPQDFIDQQRAYFKEIDEFELAVEEVSDG